MGVPPVIIPFYWDFPWNEPAKKWNEIRVGPPPLKGVVIMEPSRVQRCSEQDLADFCDRPDEPGRSFFSGVNRKVFGKDVLYSPTYATDSYSHRFPTDTPFMDICMVHIGTFFGRIIIIYPHFVCVSVCVCASV